MSYPFDPLDLIIEYDLPVILRGLAEYVAGATEDAAKDPISPQIDNYCNLRDMLICAADLANIIDEAERKEEEK